MHERLRPGADVTLRRATISEILSLRRDELRPGLSLDEARFVGDDDPGSRHFGAFLAATGENIGCASFVPAPFEGRVAHQLRGMATRADFVRRGIGAALLTFAVDALPPTPLLWCNARIGAVPFYRRMGWRVVSDAFDVPTVGPHVRMICERA